MRKGLLIATLLVIILLAKQPIEPESPSAIVFNPLSTSDDSSKISTMLDESGYTVHEFKNGESTVTIFKQIPPDTDLIVFRVHSSIHNEAIWLYTGEMYSNEKHQLDQLVDNIHMAKATIDQEPVFSLGSGFFERYLPTLDGSIVLVLGCDAAVTDELANVFLSKGASSYVSWDGPVSLEHTDKAFTVLIQHILRGETVETAVEHVKSTTGPDPYFHSSLICYK